MGGYWGLCVRATLVHSRRALETRDMGEYCTFLRHHSHGTYFALVDRLERGFRRVDQ